MIDDYHSGMFVGFVLGAIFMFWALGIGEHLK